MPASYFEIIASTDLLQLCFYIHFIWTIWKTDNTIAISVNSLVLDICSVWGITTRRPVQNEIPSQLCCLPLRTFPPYLATLETRNVEISATREPGSLQTVHLHSFLTRDHSALWMRQGSHGGKKIGNYLFKGHFWHAHSPTSFYFTVVVWFLVPLSLFIPSFQSLTAPSTSP